MSAFGNRAAIAAAFVLGGAAGYAIGLLTAPASGEKTRRELASSVRERRVQLIRSGRRAVDKAAEKIEDGIEQGRRRIAHAFAG